MQSSKKIILFGGSFDPVHFGHTKILKKAMDIVQPDKVLVLPNFQTPLKDRVLTPGAERLAMLKLAFKNWPLVEVSDYEIAQNQKCYTIDTLEHFQEIYTDHEFYILLGSDQMVSFKQWKRYDELYKKAKIICYKRQHYCKCCRTNTCLCDTPVRDFQDIIYLKEELVELSSTEIRKEPLKPYSLNVDVLNYINDHGLYAIERIQQFEKESRFKHSLRVGYMAKQLMQAVKPEWAHLAYSAGIYHDICKDMPLDLQVDIAENILGITDYVSPKVLHGYIGAYKLKAEYGFSNDLVLDAIRRHTKPFDYYETEPTLLDKVVYLADKLEPNRTDEDVCGDIEYFRALAKQDIDKCFVELFEHTQRAFNRK
ncbi:nicotinate-nucleotide adenylyltransferase [Ureaplasma ceti]|uniref:Probable nicotinate-nucleotide adenylyltransferase n=1 Tax=Ureaplasma ceti TaxID=3119530 RepID=A0ABP9U9K0_9BACT